MTRMTCQRLMPPRLPPAPPSHPLCNQLLEMEWGAPPRQPFSCCCLGDEGDGAAGRWRLSFPQRNYFLSSVALIKTLAPPTPTPPPLPQQIYPSSSCKCGPNMLNKSLLSFQTPTRWSRGGRRASVKAVSRRTLMVRYKVSTCKLDLKRFKERPRPVQGGSGSPPAEGRRLAQLLAESLI